MYINTIRVAYVTVSYHIISYHMMYCNRRRPGRPLGVEVREVLDVLSDSNLTDYKFIKEKRPKKQTLICFKEIPCQKGENQGFVLKVNGLFDIIVGDISQIPI